MEVRIETRELQGAFIAKLVDAKLSETIAGTSKAGVTRSQAIAKVKRIIKTSEFELITNTKY